MLASAGISRRYNATNVIDLQDQISFPSHLLGRQFFRQMWRTQPFLTNHNGLARRSGGEIIRTGFDWFSMRVSA